MQAAGGDEEDDDTWVREQIRKGVGGRTANDANAVPDIEQTANSTAAFITPEAAGVTAEAAQKVISSLRQGLTRLKVEPSCSGLLNAGSEHQTWGGPGCVLSASGIVSSKGLHGEGYQVKASCMTVNYQLFTVHLALCVIA